MDEWIVFAFVLSILIFQNIRWLNRTNSPPPTIGIAEFAFTTWHIDFGNGKSWHFRVQLCPECQITFVNYDQLVPVAISDKFAVHSTSLKHANSRHSTRHGFRFSGGFSDTQLSCICRTIFHTCKIHPFSLLPRLRRQHGNLFMVFISFSFRLHKIYDSRATWRCVRMSLRRKYRNEHL